MVVAQTPREILDGLKRNSQLQARKTPPWRLLFTWHLTWTHCARYWFPKSLSENPSVPNHRSRCSIYQQQAVSWQHVLLAPHTVHQSAMTEQSSSNICLCLCKYQRQEPVAPAREHPISNSLDSPPHERKTGRAVNLISSQSWRQRQLLECSVWAPGFRKNFKMPTS